MDDQGFREYIGLRLDSLRRTAFLMCGDWYAADDAVSTVILKLYQDWRRISRVENLDAYVRRALVNALVDERRRPWRREHVAAEVPPPAVGSAHDSVDDRLTILKLLEAIPAGRRAVIVLRFYCNLSVEETAQVLECSTGTVKSQTSRALEALRAATVDISD